MDELERLRQKKLMELQQQQMQQVDEDTKFQEQIALLEQNVKSIMSKEAIERYGNIKTVDEKKAVQILVIIGQLMENGRVRSIDDNQFKALLKELAPKKHEFNIRRK